MSESSLKAAAEAAFLNSISLAGPIIESEARALMPKLLDAYFSAYPKPEIRRIIQRTLPLLRRMAGIAGLFQHWSKKGIRHVLIPVNVLEGVK